MIILFQIKLFLNGYLDKSYLHRQTLQQKQNPDLKTISLSNSLEKSQQGEFLQPQSGVTVHSVELYSLLKTLTLVQHTAEGGTIKYLRSDINEQRAIGN